jgi:acyl carrier protein
MMSASAEQIMSELTPIFREVLENSALELSPDMTAKDVDGWDSFSHVKLIAAIEQHYRIRFRLRDIVKFRNVGDICGAICRSME